MASSFPAIGHWSPAAVTAPRRVTIGHVNVRRRVHTAPLADMTGTEAGMRTQSSEQRWTCHDSVKIVMFSVFENTQLNDISRQSIQTKLNSGFFFHILLDIY